MSSATEKSWKRLASAMTGARRSANANAAFSTSLSDDDARLLSNLPGLASLHNGDGTMIWANSKLKILFGLDENQDLANSYFADMNPQDLPVVRKAMFEALEWSEEREAEFKLLNRQGHSDVGPRTFEVQCSPFSGGQAGTDGHLVLALTRETTQSVQELSNLKEKLHQTEIDRAERNRFFSSMSHELRTPLNAIIGFSELLEGKAAIQVNEIKKLEYAGVINESATHLLSLINDILDLSKLEEGKQEKLIAELDLYDLLQTTVRTMMPAAMAKHIDLVLDCDRELPAVQSDSRVLRQIFTNLVSNAVKFSSTGDEVRIKVTRLRNRYKVSVIDSGIGMDAETLSRLGGVFYQAGDVVKGDYEGSGLGMSIVFKLVELVDGKIAVNSKPGMGTTVSVILPTGSSAATPVPNNSDDDVVYLHKPEVEERQANRKFNKVSGVS